MHLAYLLSIRGCGRLSVRGKTVCQVYVHTKLPGVHIWHKASLKPVLGVSLNKYMYWLKKTFTNNKSAHQLIGTADKWSTKYHGP